MRKRLSWMIAAVLMTASCQQQSDTRQPEEARLASHEETSTAQPGFPGKRFREAFENLAAHFEQEVQRDSNDVAAHAGLSEAYSTLWCFGFYSRSEALPKARAAATKAVQLDDELAAAHTALGIVKLCDWDWVGAERAFIRAIQLDPGDAKARHWHALYLAAMGRHEQAMAESTQAENLDPTSLGFKTGKGAVLYFGHKFEEMRQQMLGTIALDPDFAWGYDWLGMAFVQLEQFDQAIETYEKAVELSDRTAEVMAGLGHAYGVAGNKSAGKKVLEELDALAERWYVPPVQRAYVCFGLGERDRAFELLEEAYADRSWELVFLREEPWFDEVRSDPRFVNLQERMQFPEKPHR